MEVSARRAQRLIKSRNRLEGQGGPPGTDEKRCDRHMQAIDDAGAKEAGDRDTTAFDEHSPVAFVAQRFEDR